ncbi:hypothetical protein BZA05DRAFT_419530 [Tricharina praecox]|uniref:uncharacterized protein n=1 Tax=Tricharina praecox TaxID=43433 RepID=UPI00221E5C84|nr:uncharacterized protein BZA05DRAFT_419530 [Tricharina praecox]KAI5849703.1 hypothetical protein BZA05DRAFT_419530 [Tricharina praecox]
MTAHASLSRDPSYSIKWIQVASGHRLSASPCTIAAGLLFPNLPVLYMLRKESRTENSSILTNTGGSYAGRRRCGHSHTCDSQHNGRSLRTTDNEDSNRCDDSRNAYDELPTNTTSNGSSNIITDNNDSVPHRQQRRASSSSSTSSSRSRVHVNFAPTCSPSTRITGYKRKALGDPPEKLAGDIPRAKLSNTIFNEVVGPFVLVLITLVPYLFINAQTGLRKENDGNDPSEWRKRCAQREKPEHA